MTFLQCAFSYVASSFVPGQMQIHNGCICAAGDLIERGNWKRPSASLFDKELTLIEVVAI